jgi:hypothetical protein
VRAGGPGYLDVVKLDKRELGWLVAGIRFEWKRWEALVEVSVFNQNR